MEPTPQQHTPLDRRHLTDLEAGGETEAVESLLLEIVREVSQPATRSVLERTVCDRLVESAHVRSAWIGERELGGDRIVPRVVAGDDAGHLDEATVNVADDGSPAARSLHTGEVQTLDADDPAFEPWCDCADASGPVAIAAVPLCHGETVYGVLEVHAPRSDPFTVREQAGFDALGRTAGAVIHAARCRELLSADSVVELSFDITDADVALVEVASERECTLELEGYVDAGDEWLVYLAVDGADPGAVTGAVDDGSTYPDSRVVVDGDDCGQVELTATETSLVHSAVALGVTVASCVVAPTSARLEIDAPTGVDVREVVEGIRREYPAVELRSHRKRDREMRTVGSPDGVLGELTDRQRDVLMAAYRSGYFGWPRESTAEEVADSLGIDSSTLHGHLRKAEGRLLSAMLDDL